mgnify:CR=1 FL=1
MSVATELVEVPVRSAAEIERLAALVLAEHQVLTLAEAWFETWVHAPDPGLRSDRALYDAVEALRALRLRR